MEWSFGNTVMLAGIVKQYPILYDGTIHYRKRQFAWGLVAQRIGQGATPQDCKIKWSNLKKEFILGRTSPTPCALTPHLSFLLPFMKQLQTTEERALDPLNSLKYLIKLTGLVREHPCLYNKRGKQLRASIWEQIATDMEDGTTGTQCQTRWLRLRNRYTNSLRMGTPMTPNGMKQHLEFLNEYVNVQPQILQKPPPPFKESEDDKFLYKLIDVVRDYPILYDGTKFNPAIFETNWQNVAKTLGNGATASDCRYRWRKLRKNFKLHLKGTTFQVKNPALVQRLEFLKPYVMYKRPAEDTHMTEAERRAGLLVTFGRQCQALRIDIRDSDTMHLLNFLPDMASMDEAQKRRFRIGAVKAAREILGDDATDWR
ncbi:hypothetical protein pipiens_018291 [Culex pipiens pipiens]|uniref:MADF domain-containing protein n=1 Tax=Culex pipiens pipiens TaxID=38569 RepID=A0ABD1CCH7_CULPP